MFNDLAVGSLMLIYLVLHFTGQSSGRREWGYSGQTICHELTIK